MRPAYWEAFIHWLGRLGPGWDPRHYLLSHDPTEFGALIAEICHIDFLAFSRRNRLCEKQLRAEFGDSLHNQTDNLRLLVTQRNRGR